MKEQNQLDDRIQLSQRTSCYNIYYLYLIEQATHNKKVMNNLCQQEMKL